MSGEPRQGRRRRRRAGAVARVFRRRERGVMGLAGPDGLVPVLEAAGMQAADRRAAADFGLPGRVLMEHAGTGVARRALRLLARRRGSWRTGSGGNTGKTEGPVLVLAGQGNNGGDGFVAARLLELAGLEARVFLAGRTDAVQGDARANLEAWLAAGGTCHELGEERLSRLHAALAGASLVVDALLGTGIRGEVRGVTARVIDALARTGGAPQVLAVDIPSGVNADTGAVHGAAVTAAATITFGVPKPGHFLYPGAGHVGRLFVEPISMPPATWAPDDQGLRLVTAPAVAGVLPRRPADGHKGSFGRVAIVAGSSGMSGAAVLAARGALYGGAGLTTLLVPRSIQELAAAALPEVMTVGLADDSGRLAPPAAEALPEHIQAMDTVACGPGLRQDDGSLAVVERLVRDWQGPLVLDADALNLLTGSLDSLRRRPGPTILTPHPGEAARLLESTAAEVQADRLQAARSLQVATGAAVLLKGATTLTAGEEGVWFNPTGNSGMATGGSGDLLTGLIAALVGQGMEPVAAAWAGAYVHGAAGDLAAGAWGEEAVTAGRLARGLGPALRAIRRVSWGPLERAHAWLGD